MYYRILYLHDYLQPKNTVNLQEYLMWKNHSFEDDFLYKTINGTDVKYSMSFYVQTAYINSMLRLSFSSQEPARFLVLLNIGFLEIIPLRTICATEERQRSDLSGQS